VPPTSTVQFAALVRALADAARAQHLRAPTFRSPPSSPSEVRTIRRWPDGGATVAVRIRDRPPAAVLADCIEGVLVTNRLTGPAAVRTRTALWERLGDHPALNPAAAA
jgi:hypothetical protein